MSDWIMRDDDLEFCGDEKTMYAVIKTDFEGGMMTDIAYGVDHLKELGEGLYAYIPLPEFNYTTKTMLVSVNPINKGN